jgi:hypothetical protein
VPPLSPKSFTRRQPLVHNTLNHRKLINELPAYNPGAFSLAESVASRDTEAEIFYELEYIN